MKWKILSLIFLCITVALGIGYVVYWPTQTPVEPTLAVEQPQTQVVEEKPEIPTVQRLLELTNLERKKAGVKPLKLDLRLNESAQSKVDEIVDTGYYSHKNLSGYVTANDINKFMPECVWYSENLNNNAIDVTATVKSWLKSEPHKKAILDSVYEYTGFGINNGFVAQHFCSID